MRLSQLIACIGVVLAMSSPVQAEQPATGQWRAWLDSPGGELPFGLKLKQTGDNWSAWLINGTERIEIPKVRFENGDILFDIEHYDAILNAKVSRKGKRLDGEWRKTTKNGEVSKLPFHAQHKGGPRFATSTSHGKPAKKLANRWKVKFEKSDEPAIMLLDHHADGKVGATIMTTTGDYRFLEGLFDAGRLRLSVFDGAHAFLFDATMQPDGGLVGHFWSRDVWHESFTADPDPMVTLADGFEMVGFDRRFDISTLEFPGLDGRTRKLSEPALSGKVRLIEVFGTWCPNCHDASTYLQSLYEKYRSDGLIVVGLAFELTGDFNRDARQVKRFVDRYDVTYPMLLAGKADKGTIPSILPFLTKFRAYPTTVFVGSDNRIHAVHTGFTGPATGKSYKELQREFERIIKELLEEAK